MAWQGKTAFDKNIILKSSLFFDPFFWKILMQTGMLKTVISKKKGSLEILSISLIMGVGGKIGAFMYSVE